jgi:RNA polymerase sigma-70 factor (ECF subfamily)
VLFRSLKLHDALPRFRGEADILTWVYRITTNHCLNRLRSRDSERRALVAEADRAARGPAADTTELRDLLAAILREHSVEDVAILLHRHADEMTQVEIAAVVGLSERTVRDRLKRLEEEARASLAALARTWEDRP